MQISPISFKSTYILNKQDLTPKKIIRLHNRADEFGMTFMSSEYQKPNNLFVNVEDFFDPLLEKVFEKLDILATRINRNQTLSTDKIKSRMVLNEEINSDSIHLIEIDAKKLDEELKKDRELYIGPKGINGSGQKYERFLIFLDTEQTIKSPIIYLKRNGKGEIKTHVYDGRHRLSVLRDLGMEKIPVTIDEKSIELAKEIGLI